MPIFIQSLKRKMPDHSKLRNAVISPIMSIWYNYLSRRDPKAEVLFLNFGYAGEDALPLQEADEANRFCIQLYHHTVGGIDLRGKKVLEVSCGKGGGADYIARYYQPELIVGIDRSSGEIHFNKNHYQQDNLRFLEGDAMAIPFTDNSFDVMLNVESSHHYLDFDQFLAEVKRVLKPGGHFLFTDFRIRRHIPSMLRSLQDCGLQVEKEEDISKNILGALELDVQRRINLIKSLLPKILHRGAMYFSGVEGSSLYHSFKTGGRKYFYFILRK